MKRVLNSLVFLMGLTSTYALGVEGPEFEIDSNIVEKVYEKTTEGQGRNSIINTPKMGAYLSLVSINEMELKNDYFRVDYKSADSIMPLFVVHVAPLSLNWNRFTLAGDVSLGYSYRDDIYDATKQNGTVLKDSISLQWLPISAQIKASYQTPYAITPYVSVGAGTQFIRQNGTLDGISQSYWVPFSIATSGIAWFDRSTSTSGGFSGMTTGVTFSTNFGSEQTVEYWSLDLGANFAM